MQNATLNCWYKK